MARLVLQTPQGTQVSELAPHNTLGRHPQNSIQVLDKIVSKEHCIIELRGDQYVLRDLGSLNGTYVNGERVAGERGLRPGDEILLGGTRAIFEPVAPSPFAAAVPVPPIPFGQRLGGAGDGITPPPGGTPSAGTQPVAAFARPAAPVGTSPTHLPAIPGAPLGASPLGASPLAAPQGGTPQAGRGTPTAVSPFVAIAAPPSARPAPVVRKTISIDRDEAMRLQQQAHVQLVEKERAIGNQMAANLAGFRPYGEVAATPAQLAADYERLRLSYELSREIALERDLPKLLNRILLTIFKFVPADRGVIFLRNDDGDLTPGASIRRDGTAAPISVSSTIMNHVIEARATVLTHDAAMDFAASKGKSMILNQITSAIVTPLLHEDEVLGVLWLDSASLAQFQQKDMELVTGIAHQAAMFIEINILGRRVQQETLNRERFSRLLSPNVAERVISGELDVIKGGQRVEECTVFNSDIRGFTSMSEGVTPETMVEMLNEYFELMVETLFEYEGTLDKFMGDGIMALWGAPVVHPDDAVRSVHCSLKMMKVLATFNAERAAVGKPELAIGIGIHTGPLVAGYIGSSRALSYTVIGDTANTSARLCGIAKPGQTIVSEATLQRLQDRFLYEELPPAQLKGKEKPFRIFTILGER